MKIVIIEDEELTANDLAVTILKVDKTVQITAILNSVKESISYFKENRDPDLIFCDIQLGDGLSFEIFQKCSITVPVIFCTAFDEYALKAFKTNGIDYILKPFSKQTIQDALQRYKTLKNNFLKTDTSFSKILELFENRTNIKKNTILVYHRENIIPVKAEDIAIFYIENEVTHLITFTRKHHTINKTIEELEPIAGDNFFRANRQFLINRNAIKDASQYFARKLNVSLTIPFSEKITISKEKVTLFLDWLSGK
ncbi:MAG: DNA-binding response regulator [Bacteroidetes bacterium GWE2_41_25]|nr:MAG: DNA-binding response regulator [Bacteroidetes bacterium GWE2_41_25]HCT84623.1 DNA-binding response regulator [Candidatus Margulisiibacteriota bacterium]